MNDERVDVFQERRAFITDAVQTIQSWEASQRLAEQHVNECLVLCEDLRSGYREMRDAGVPDHRLTKARRLLDEAKQVHRRAEEQADWAAQMQSEVRTAIANASTDDEMEWIRYGLAGGQQG